MVEMHAAVRDAMDRAERVGNMVRGRRQFAQPTRREERGQWT
jgi:hypothetical protein